MVDFTGIWSALSAHAWLLACWLLLTAVINTVFHFATPEDVDAWAEKNPFVAKVAAFFRRFGIEPVAGLVVLRSFFSAKPPPPGPIGKTGTRRLPPVMVLLVAAILLAPIGCVDGRLSPKVADGLKIAECVAAAAAAGLTPAQVVVKCGVDDESEIRDILAKHKVGVMKELVAAGKDCAR